MSRAVTCGLDFLGAEVIPTRGRRRSLSLSRGIIALGAGALGALLYPKHWVLAMIDSAALASNVHAVMKGDRAWQDATRRMGRHVVATAGSLAMPAFPAIGYIAGAVAADLFIDGEGHGIVEELSEYVDIGKGTIIDAEIVENPKALTKVT